MAKVVTGTHCKVAFIPNITFTFYGGYVWVFVLEIWSTLWCCKNGVWRGECLAHTW